MLKVTNMKRNIVYVVYQSALDMRYKLYRISYEVLVVCILVENDCE